jgi:hypothetical protein
MKKLFAKFMVAVVVLTAASFVMAAKPAKHSRHKIKGTRAKMTEKSKGKALVTLDYYNLASAAFYNWSGDFYMSNLFKPAGGSYPLDVIALEVYADGLDNNTVTGAAGVLNGVAVFDPAGTILKRELAVPVAVRTWTTVPLTPPLPNIATGNFYAGLWNSADASAGGAITAINDAGVQASATAWTGPPTEPFECMDGPTGSTAGGAGPWAPGGCGAAYATVSAASVRAQINTNVPVELMRFVAE